MDNNGNIYPFIPYNLLLDTDIGLLRLINKKYKKEDVFGTGILEAPLNTQRYFLLKRQYINVLQAIAIDPTDKELYDEYYEQFMDEELEEILKNSVSTSIYDMVKSNARDGHINYTIWVPDERIKDFLLKADPITFKSCNIADTPNIGSAIEVDINEPIYLKDIKDLIRYPDKVEGKNIYLANYQFNYNEEMIEDEYFLNSDVMNIMGSRVAITLYEPYRENEYNAIIG